MDTPVGCRLQGGGAVSMLCNDVGSLIHQHFRGIGFLARVVPGIYPDNFDFDVGVLCLRPEHEGIDAPDNLGYWERGDIADDTAL